jgi:hypothetical protein
MVMSVMAAELGFGRAAMQVGSQVGSRQWQPIFKCLVHCSTHHKEATATATATPTANRKRDGDVVSCTPRAGEGSARRQEGG